MAVCYAAESVGYFFIELFLGPVWLNLVQFLQFATLREVKCTSGARPWMMLLLFGVVTSSRKGVYEDE